MTRPIKFRGWDDERKEMFPPVDLSKSREHYMWLGASDIQIMQYTGLTDKNGKEIYEGDFLSWPTRTFPKDQETVYRVGFNGYMWDIYNCKEYQWDGNGFRLFMRAEDMEVIGNVYENPDLLFVTPLKEGEWNPLSTTGTLDGVEGSGELAKELGKQ